MLHTDSCGGMRELPLAQTAQLQLQTPSKTWITHAFEQVLQNSSGCLVGAIRRLHLLALLVEAADGCIAFPQLPRLVDLLRNGQASAQRLLCLVPVSTHRRAVALDPPSAALKLSRLRGDSDLQALISEPIRSDGIAACQRHFAEADVAVR